MNIAICDENHQTGEYIKNQATTFMHQVGLNARCFAFERAVDLLACDKAFDIVIMESAFAEVNNAPIISFIKRYRDTVALILIGNDYSCLDVAFDVGARRYLLKPVDDETLLSALQSAIEYLNNKTAECYMQENGTVKRISKSSIVYLEIFGRKTKIVTDNGVFLSKIKMLDFQKSLNPAQFASPHKSFFVNMAQIKEFGRLGGQYYILMMDNKFIPITRTRKSEFEKAYFQFLATKTCCM